MQKHWPPGTQCVTKHDHSKPKAQELAFHKGDVVTIIEAVEVSPTGVWGTIPGAGISAIGGAAGASPPPPFPLGSPFPSLALSPSRPQGKGWYRARHNKTGQEGLLAASALRERGAIRADPKLSLMP